MRVHHGVTALWWTFSTFKINIFLQFKTSSPNDRQVNFLITINTARILRLQRIIQPLNFDDFF
jgi:hypothetical protein